MTKQELKQLIKECILEARKLSVKSKGLPKRLPKGLELDPYPAEDSVEQGTKDTLTNIKNNLVSAKLIKKITDMSPTDTFWHLSATLKANPNIHFGVSVDKWDGEITLQMDDSSTPDQRPRYNMLKPKDEEELYDMIQNYENSLDNL